MTGVIYTAIDCKVKKLVVATPAPEALNFELATGVSSSMPAMLAALMETVVVAEARYLGPDSDTSICSARLDKALKLETRNLKLMGYAFSEAKNGDLLLHGKEGVERIPCENFGKRR